MEKYKRLTDRETAVMLKNTEGSSWDSENMEAQRYIKLAELEDKIEDKTLIELPKKCYQVIWALGWEIIEYDVVSITYDYDKATITKVIAVRPYSQQVFTNRGSGHFDEIGADVFFSKAKAEKKLRGLQNETK